MDATFTLTVNGQRRTVSTDPQRLLLDVLREDFQLTGTKYGCGEGQCGACTVLVEGEPAFSCRTPVSEVDQKSIVTVEGLAEGEMLHAVQQAFLKVAALQCGYCTPGMIMATVALLRKSPLPTDEQIAAAMERHICRCCAYPRILQAVRRASAKLSGVGP
jgi:aerobic-type carbon monoxide dehydrogenase small subunit (CoxS/CutS family)